MAFGGFNQGSERQPTSDINMVPLIDVMLVLLIVFMITAPLLTHSVKIDLPKAASQPNEEKPETITLAMDGEGQLFWNNAPLAAEVLKEKLAGAAAQQPQPELHLRADQNTRYQKIAEVMSAAREAGIEKMGFITVPNE
ncbi:biopolymer transporter ExbD [Azoarcus communis]|uniref:Biopolymer transporter ExbD n=1 Tax=Parazoarcus communis SWub3 = DSM 12120 TaxID=1121029 RepID=A0A323V2M4_9RHOO|nr:biopolymer transporter ExbD [Parazoarcus communis]NMG47303.1 biopolymer transporter ExbD [Parazoarcus communis]NMG70185.1 biopolymer transporter ExbD [Parazoarcus communis SWub3 = DSM 12120]PZA18353.1 biopolymer transporter ExbD [Azoarcus communis] [Parazoarcus communis SWub3 = DSM 12120]